MDPAVGLTYVGTKEQMGDTFTKGAFTAMLWKNLLDIIQIGQPPTAPPNINRNTHKLMYDKQVCVCHDTDSRRHMSGLKQDEQELAAAQPSLRGN